MDSQAPYPAFPPGLAREFDVIEIRRTWHFDMAIRLHWGAESLSSMRKRCGLWDLIGVLHQGRGKLMLANDFAARHRRVSCRAPSRVTTR